MRISKEARILFGLMLLAALGLIWANIYFQSGGSFNSGGAGSGSLSSSRPPVNEADTATTTPEAAPGISVAPGGSALDDAIDSTAPDTAALPLDEVAPLDGSTLDDTAVDAPSIDGVSVEGSSADGSTVGTTPNSDAVTGVSVEGAAEDVLTEEGLAEAAPVAAAPLAPSAARDVEIVTLPFLVTAPPTSEEGLAQDADANTINRPGEQRVSVNPFSPILLQAVEAPSVPNNVPEVTVVDVPIPEAPPVADVQEVAAPPSPETAPPLRTFTPPTPVAATLPRPLPSGTLPTTPGILRSTQPAPSSQASATLRLPGSTTDLPTNAAASEPVEASEDLPTLQGTDASSAPRDCGPVAAGACTLSVYLRDQNVRFTGYVIGPVGVGVFRINGRSAPLVLPIGQNLLETQDTDIVLTSLEGKQAEFTRGNETQFLTLDFRR